MKPILLDTGFLVALLDRREKKHVECSQILDSLDGPLITCEPVVSEAAYLLRLCVGAADRIFRNIEERVIQIPWQISGNESRLRKLLTKYDSREMDLADACLVLMAEDFSTPDILTLDNDFEHYRWAGTRAFKMLPSSHK